MIRLCPFCGYKLSSPLHYGITTCDHCGRVFETTIYNHILSAAWMVRRWHIQDPNILRNKFGFSEFEVDLVSKYVIEGQHSHDE
jgi:hypothetical protein